MKQAIFSNWNFMRLIRLVLGITIIVQSIITKDWVVGILGIVFIAMPMFNIGCCAVSGCTTPPKKVVKTPKDIAYEEVV